MNVSMTALVVKGAAPGVADVLAGTGALCVGAAALALTEAVTEGALLVREVGTVTKGAADAAGIDVDGPLKGPADGMSGFKTTLARSKSA